MSSNTMVFYAGKLYEHIKDHQLDIPDGAYIRYPNDKWAHKNIATYWILSEDVPKELRLMALLLTGES